MKGKKVQGLERCLVAQVMVPCVLACIMFVPYGIDAEIIDRIVAVVNEDIITLSELRDISLPYLERMKSEFSVTYGEEEIKGTERRILDQLIDEKLVNQEADTLKIEITEKEVTMASREVKGRAKLTEEQFEQALAEDGMTIESYREQLRSEMKKMRLIDQEVKAKVHVTKKEIDEYYKMHRDEYNAPPEVRLQQILLIIPAESSPQEVEQIREKAEQVRAAIKQGEDFNAMVKRYSQDTTAATGGDMGVFRQGELFSALDEAAFTLMMGEVSPVIQTPKGFHIIRVLDKKDRRKMTEEEKREEIDTILYNQKVEEALKQWIKKLKKKSYVVINL
jgi:peptidyl-prolyl cis-trans isomerase SurA